MTVSTQRLPTQVDLLKMEEGGLDKFALDNAKRAVSKAHAEELAKLHEAEARATR